MQFIDLHKQFDLIEADVRKGFDEVFKHKRFIMGEEISRLEEQLKNYVGVKHALACSSGTDALVIALMAYQLKETDAVFVPSFTFFASAESVTLAGGTPVFVDSNPDTFNIDPASLKEAVERVRAEGKLTPKGVIPVDLFGQPADYEAVRAIAEENGMFILEDAAQGFGGVYHGKRAGSLGNIGATSFFPAKPLGCYGDGGAIFTDDDALYALMHSIRVHGQGTDRYDNVRIGVNGRLDTFQAVVLMAKLKVFDDELVTRNQAAAEYTRRLKDVVKTPVVPEGLQSSWAQYTLQAKDEAQRDKVLETLRAKNIPVMVYYPSPAHLATAYAGLGYRKGDLPVCEKLSKTVFSLPMHPYLTEEEIAQVSDAVKEGLR